MKNALVCGAGGFIGSHLVKRLKNQGFWVRGVDLKSPEFDQTHADEAARTANQSIFHFIRLSPTGGLQSCQLRDDGDSAFRTPDTKDR